MEKESQPSREPAQEDEKAIGWQLKLATQPERVAQAMDDARNESNHRPSSDG